VNTWKTNRKTILINCENCGNEFKKTLSEYNRSEKLNKKHFCSLKCNNESKKIKLKFCLQCNEEFIPDKNKTKFCSHSCNAKYNNKNRKGIKYNISENGLIGLRESYKNNFGYDIIKFRNNYYQSQNYCKECNEPIPYEKKNHVFCNRDCKRTYDRKNLTEYQKYYKDCQFKFGLSDYPNEFDFELIKTHGWYQPKNHGNNLGGISRDHMISVKYGYENNISSEIISHPANCQLMIHNENISKYKNCSITLEELMIKIDNWNEKYSQITMGLT